MNVYTSEIEMLRAQCREWEKVFDSHLRLIKKLKKGRQWVGLTDDDKDSIIGMTERDDRMDVIQLVEAKLKEKNT